MRPRPDFRARWKWLYAPSPQAVEFAFRNTIAALIALAIALWVELDSPVWAPSTVWAVAQATRGENLSKARWRLAGTLLGGRGQRAADRRLPAGALALFPGFGDMGRVMRRVGDFFTSYRAYTMTLAGYTCAIIALDASQAPDNVFFLAVSRSTYIGLGVVCEVAMGMIFSLQQEKRARMTIKRSLQGQELFGRILRLNSEVEYLEIEMGPHGHEGDHARADLAVVAVLLTRCLGMTARLAALKHREPRLNDMLTRVREFVLTITPRLEQDAPWRIF
ncbi:MAG: FUSC family protein [Acetobacteraceae bacterium]